MSEEQMAILYPDMYGEEDPIYDMVVGYWCDSLGYLDYHGYL